ncbi:hypothetical protein GCM10010289_46810 [Streptomyces violascens]|uniref:Uncharacterized protein n=1 Tax=Streptomyces violascens TaxID=67381 RepID=A0ABQ3QPP7_9ACTN|nr:hypothetical protein GCM10010289_46810 [Streptomyces violascens]GHI39242.1 hypothetical protein Sviol_36500 [Streptomyces violascens]
MGGDRTGPLAAVHRMVCGGDRIGVPPHASRRVFGPAAQLSFYWSELMVSTTLALISDGIGA